MTIAISMLKFMRRLPPWLVGENPQEGYRDDRWFVTALLWLSNFPDGNRYLDWDNYGWGLTAKMYENATYRVDSRTWTGRD